MANVRDGFQFFFCRNAGRGRRGNRTDMSSCCEFQWSEVQLYGSVTWISCDVSMCAHRDENATGDLSKRTSFTQKIFLMNSFFQFYCFVFVEKSIHTQSRPVEDNYSDGELPLFKEEKSDFLLQRRRS